MDGYAKIIGDKMVQCRFFMQIDVIVTASGLCQNGTQDIVRNVDAKIFKADIAGREIGFDLAFTVAIAVVDDTQNFKRRPVQGRLIPYACAFQRADRTLHQRRCSAFGLAVFQAGKRRGIDHGYA